MSVSEKLQSVVPDVPQSDESFILQQAPETIANNLYDTLTRRGKELSHETVSREVSDLWGKVKSPALRRFVAPLAENALHNRDRTNSK